MVPEPLKSSHDRMLSLLGFAGRSEMVALDVAALDVARDGMTVMIEPPIR
jgi:hypothetical protein